MGAHRQDREDPYNGCHSPHSRPGVLWLCTPSANGVRSNLLSIRFKGQSLQFFLITQKIKKRNYFFLTLYFRISIKLKQVHYYPICKVYINVYSIHKIKIILYLKKLLGKIYVYYTEVQAGPVIQF